MEWQIEGVNAARLRWGRADARPAVFRIGLNCAAGTYTIKFSNGFGNNRYYTSTVTITSGEAFTDVVKTVFLPETSRVRGTWLTASASRCLLHVCLPARRCSPERMGQHERRDRITDQRDGGRWNARSIRCRTLPRISFPNSKSPTSRTNCRCQRFYEKVRVQLLTTTGTPVTFVPKRSNPTASVTPDSGTGATFTVLGVSSAFQVAAHSASAAGTLTLNSRF